MVDAWNIISRFARTFLFILFLLTSNVKNTKDLRVCVPTIRGFENDSVITVSTHLTKFGNFCTKNCYHGRHNYTCFAHHHCQLFCFFFLLSLLFHMQRQFTEGKFPSIFSIQSSFMHIKSISFYDRQNLNEILLLTGYNVPFTSRI